MSRYSKAAWEADLKAADETRHLTRTALLGGLLNGFEAKDHLDAMDEFERRCTAKYRMMVQNMRVEEKYATQTKNAKSGMSPAQQIEWAQETLRKAKVK